MPRIASKCRGAASAFAGSRGTACRYGDFRVCSFTFGGVRSAGGESHSHTDRGSDPSGMGAGWWHPFAVAPACFLVGQGRIPLPSVPALLTMLQLVPQLRILLAVHPTDFRNYALSIDMRSVAETIRNIRRSRLSGQRITCATVA